MARADATDNELWQTLEAAHIDDFVRAQSRGLDMPITQDGANLSGGQKQRIAIARVLLRRSAVYIFDEATSSVDADSENVDFANDSRARRRRRNRADGHAPHGERGRRGPCS